MSMALLCKDAFEDGTSWTEEIPSPTPPGRFRVDDVNKAIADQLLYVDLDYDDLTEPHKVIVCSSKEQLEAVKWRRPERHTVTTHFTMSVNIGSEFAFEGNPDIFLVTAQTANEVCYRNHDSGCAAEWSTSQFLLLMDRGKLVVLSPEKTAEERLSHDEYISGHRIREARRRFELISALQNGQDVAYACSLRTIQRHRKMMRQAGNSRPLQTLALVGKNHPAGDLKSATIRSPSFER